IIYITGQVQAVVISPQLFFAFRSLLSDPALTRKEAYRQVCRGKCEEQTERLPVEDGRTWTNGINYRGGHNCEENIKLHMGV
ncbi:MAG: hypothetical protein K2O13_03140, partial [Lachnospiraceae bacterium]|nr:hypothetical protein [Lachnospiraceae bacterium]